MNILRKKIFWAIWSFLLMCYLFMAVYVMGGASKAIQQTAIDASCVKPLDLHVLGVSGPEAFKALECMGMEARSIYRQIELQEDMIYLLCYGLFFTFTIFCLASYLFNRHPIAWILPVIPLSIMIFDIIENQYIIQLIDQFPHLKSETVSRMSFFNKMKWITFITSILLILLMSIVSLLKMVRPEKKLSVAE